MQADKIHSHYAAALQDPADALIGHLEALHRRSGWDGDADRSCACRRLAKDWRRLSQDLDLVAADFGGGHGPVAVRDGAA